MGPFKIGRLYCIDCTLGEVGLIYDDCFMYYNVLLYCLYLLYGIVVFVFLFFMSGTTDGS